MYKTWADTELHRLALSHNASCILPLELAQCDRLRYLNMRWNKLDHFPTAVRNLGDMDNESNCD
jgi:hypothetical protein